MNVEFVSTKSRKLQKTISYNGTKFSSLSHEKDGELNGTFLSRQVAVVHYEQEEVEMYAQIHEKVRKHWPNATKEVFEYKQQRI
jgi:hypothetical protein